MNWLAQIHSEHDKLSSKRFYGGLLIVSVIVLAYMEKSPAILEPMLYTGAGLVGFNTVVNIAKAIKGGENENK